MTGERNEELKQRAEQASAHQTKGIETMDRKNLIMELICRRMRATEMSEKYCDKDESEYSWWDGYWQALADLQAWLEKETKSI